jgi:sporulation protein YlmC with PRC-barrel domain
MNRLEGPLDGLLHLMDRQVIDSDGLLVCKCDDLELDQRDDGTLTVTALLVGPPVWVPRVSGWLGERWRRLGGAQSDRLRPYRIDLADIERVTQEIRLRHERDGVLQRQGSDRAAARRLVDDLLGADVLGPRDEHLGHVLDVRLRPSEDEHDPVLVLTDLLVGSGRPGSYLGYDRSEHQGPWLVRRIVRRLHRHSGMVATTDVESIDWDSRRVRSRVELSHLTHVGTSAEPHERDAV